MDLQDFKSSTWKRTQARLEAQLESLRRANDQALDPIKTAAIRGQIAMVKRILAWPSEKPSDDTSDVAAQLDP